MARTSESEVFSVASVVAPEDIRHGDYVAALTQNYEIPSFYWDDCISATEPGVLSLRFRAPDAGRPFKVKAICLPFVYAKKSNGEYCVLDVRSTQLVRLDGGYARTICKREKQELAKTKKPKKKGKRKKK